jgi:hypothetical protein
VAVCCNEILETAVKFTYLLQKNTTNFLAFEILLSSGSRDFATSQVALIVFRAFLAYSVLTFFGALRFLRRDRPKVGHVQSRTRVSYCSVGSPSVSN